EDVDRIALDTLRAPLAGGAVRELAAGEGRCVALEASAGPLAATATIENRSAGGLIPVTVSLDGRSRTHWVSMRSGERRSVAFTGWEKPGPGRHTVKCGELEREVTAP
ncbi:MAG TPA: hypothetical protein VHA11_15515, partial [Bryobacteraceae bacterium]|nr:hypothetical protein [Bryobacteraceae bacterium]